MGQNTQRQYHCPALDFSITACSTLPLLCIPEITLLQRWVRATLARRRSPPWQRESLVKRKRRWRRLRIHETYTRLPYVLITKEIVRIQRWFRSLRPLSQPQLLRRALLEWARVQKQLKHIRLRTAFENHTCIPTTDKNWIFSETCVIQITSEPLA
jgi:hypothetical protein